MSIDRYKKAWGESYSQVLSEILLKEKHSHWAWWIFPQVRGLGMSETSQQYALQSMNEAVDFIADEYLVELYHDILQTIIDGNADSLQLTGWLPAIDVQKFHASLTVFRAALAHERNHGLRDLINKSLATYFNGVGHKPTMEILERGF